MNIDVAVKVNNKKEFVYILGWCCMVWVNRLSLNPASCCDVDGGGLDFFFRNEGSRKNSPIFALVDFFYKG